MTHENRTNNGIHSSNPQTSEPKPSSWEWAHTNRELDRLSRRLHRLRTLAVVLLLTLVGASAYGYFALRKHGFQLSELPSLQESLALVGERLDAAETRLRTWSADWDALDVRLNKLEGRLGRTVAAAREAARKQAQELTAQLQARLEAQLHERDQVIDARLSRLEAEQQASRIQLATLGGQVSAVQQQTGRDLGTLHQQVARSERNVDELARQLQRRRVDFELARDYTQELAPGVALHITETNQPFQRVKGWLWLMPDRRTVWVRELGLQQPLVFYHRDSDQPNELVITRVAKDAVIGYLLLPADQEVTVGAAPAPPRRSLGEGGRDPFSSGSTAASTTAPAGLN
jgi:hypothetical protein